MNYSTCSVFSRQRLHAVYQNHKWTPHKNKKAEPVQSVKMNIYQSNTTKKLNWLHFDNQPRNSRQAASAGPTLLHTLLWSLSNTSKQQLGASAMNKVFHAWLHGRFIEIKSNLRRKKLHRTYKGSNFSESSFSNRDYMRASIQFRRERQSHDLERWFSLKNRPIHFYKSTRVIRPVKQYTLFLAMKSYIESFP